MVEIRVDILTLDLLCTKQSSVCYDRYEFPDSRGGEYYDYCLLGCDCVLLIRKCLCFGGPCCLHLQGRRKSLKLSKLRQQVPQYCLYLCTKHHCVMYW
jgi:hypothetical protein